MFHHNHQGTAAASAFHAAALRAAGCARGRASVPSASRVSPVDPMAQIHHSVAYSQSASRTGYSAHPCHSQREHCVHIPFLPPPPNHLCGEPSNTFFPIPASKNKTSRLTRFCGSNRDFYFHAATPGDAQIGSLARVATPCVATTVAFASKTQNITGGFWRPGSRNGPWPNPPVTIATQDCVSNPHAVSFPR
jgi:hypothetical protein